MMRTINNIKARALALAKAYPKLGIGLAVCLVGLCLWGATQCQRKSTPAPRVVIQAEDYTLPDTLRVITLSGSTTYFEYRDEPMGYQYDLIKEYADSRSLPYIVEVASSMEDIHSALSSGKSHLSITPEEVGKTDSSSHLLYTGPEILSGLVLLQRKQQSTTRGSAPYLKDVTELIGRRVYSIRGSREEARLRRLEEQLGDTISIVSIERDSLGIEELIGMVSDRSIDYLCCDSELAGIAATYYANLDIRTVIGFPQRMRWRASPSAGGVRADIERWSVGGQGKMAFNHVHRKYFDLNKSTEVASPITDEELDNLPKGTLSPYDEIFRAEAKRTPWAWPLLAAIAYQESRFDASVIGWSGARGLMGIMPRTGRIFGAETDELLDPHVSVRVSVDCLLNVYDLYAKIKDPVQRLKLALASYNAGQGHVQDAQRLAEKYGADPHVWDGNVAEYILLKSTAKYYQDPVCRSGYLRGKETYNYVEEVYSRYLRYSAKLGK